MIRKIALSMLAAAALADPAGAADLMPLKAPLRSIITPYSGQGCYWGINTEAGVAQTKVDGGLFATSLVGGTLAASGGAIGGTIGCIRGTGANWWAFEAKANWQNISAAAPIPGVTASVASRWNSSQVVKYGGVDNVLTYLPSFGISFPTLQLPSIPSAFNVAPNTSHPYIMAGVQEFGYDVGFGSGNNKTWAIAPLVGMGVKNQLLGKDGKVSGAVLDLGAKVVFSNKGKTVNFAGSGPTFGGAAKIGTQYLAYLGVDFAAGN